MAYAVFYCAQAFVLHLSQKSPVFNEKLNTFFIEIELQLITKLL